MCHFLALLKWKITYSNLARIVSRGPRVELSILPGCVYNTSRKPLRNSVLPLQVRLSYRRQELKIIYPEANATSNSYSDNLYKSRVRLLICSNHPMLEYQQMGNPYPLLPNHVDTVVTRRGNDYRECCRSPVVNILIADFRLPRYSCYPSRCGLIQTILP